jgi:HAD superfamily phosphoserine phosphatase-like hydrolase
MKKINVIDFDGTLIKNDSLREFYTLLLKHSKSRLRLIIAALKNAAGVINNEIFLDEILNASLSLKNRPKRIDDFIERILKDRNEEIYNEIKRQTDENTVNILCSASPELYMKKIAEKLGFECICSRYENGKIVRMYGPEKVKAINSIYPREKFNYNFAISDSASDIDLLKQFSNYKLIK